MTIKIIALSKQKEGHLLETMMLSSFGFVSFCFGTPKQSKTEPLFLSNINKLFKNRHFINI
jgi:hypothetical protein